MTVAPVTSNVTALRSVPALDTVPAPRARQSRTTLKPPHLATVDHTTGLSSAEDVRHAVALYAAATLLPARTPLGQRETARVRWYNALKVIAPLDQHPQWALAYVPGVHHGHNDTYAVHLPTGAVFGGDCAVTGQQWRESTHQWLTRLTGDLDTLLTSHRPRYTRRDDLA